MAKSVNKVILLGHVGSDPEVRILPSKTKVANLRLATTDKFKDGQNNWQERTEWHNLVGYAHHAEAIEKFVGRGSKIYIEGKLTTRVWGEDGERKYRTEVKIEEMVLASAPKQNAEQVSEPAEDDGWGKLE